MYVCMFASSVVARYPSIILRSSIHRRYCNYNNSRATMMMRQSERRRPPLAESSRERRRRHHRMISSSSSSIVPSQCCWSIVLLLAAVVAATLNTAPVLVSGYSHQQHIPKVARPQSFATSRGIPKSSSSPSATTADKKDSPEQQHRQSFTARPPSKRSSTSKVAMTSTFLTEQPPTSSFESRMRDMVLGGHRQKASKAIQRQRKANLPRNVQFVETLQEYRKIVGDEHEKIVVARFYAPWCKACRATQPVFYRMATKFTNVKFVDVPVTDDNATLHQGLGVPSVPFGHIYHPSIGLVEEVRISRKQFSQFGHKLQTYVRGSCDLQDGSCKNPYQDEEKEEEEE